MTAFNSHESRSGITGSGIHSGNQVAGDRRAARRHQANLQSSVLITGIDTSAFSEERYYVLQGQLLDVSVSGLALVVSRNDIRELQRLGEHIRLLLMLPLPAQAIELEAVPVRYRPLNDRTDAVLLGAQIVNMSGRDRIIFMDFINQCDSLTFNRDEAADLG